MTETDGMPDYRFCDRELQHSLAYNGAAVFDFLKANGLPFEDEAPDNFQANHASGVSALRGCTLKSNLRRKLTFTPIDRFYKRVILLLS